MKISNISKLYQTYETKPVVSGKKAVSGEKKDKLNVSEQAKEFQVAFKAALSSSSVREDKISDIKNRIEDGSYNVSVEDIANKMMRYI